MMTGFLPRLQKSNRGQCGCKLFFNRSFVLNARELQQKTNCKFPVI